MGNQYETKLEKDRAIARVKAAALAAGSLKITTAKKLTPKINEKKLKEELKVLLNAVKAEKNSAEKKYLNYESPSLTPKSKYKKEKIKWQKI